MSATTCQYTHGTGNEEKAISGMVTAIRVPAGGPMPTSLSGKEERAQLCLPSFILQRALAAPRCGTTHAKATGHLGSLPPARQGTGPGCYKPGLSKLQVVGGFWGDI